jgi:hypothetical protein
MFGDLPYLNKYPTDGFVQYPTVSSKNVGYMFGQHTIPVPSLLLNKVEAAITNLWIESKAELDTGIETKV